MANWLNLAKAALLADGQIDDRKTAALRQELFADKRIERSELDLLLSARKEARSVCPAYEKLVRDAIRTSLLADGKVSADEVAWLKGWIFADGKSSPPPNPPPWRAFISAFRPERITCKAPGTQGSAGRRRARFP